MTETKYLALLTLLQLTNSSLPVGAYSYSEGLESLVDSGTIKDEKSLEYWLKQELFYGAIRLEAALMIRGYRAARQGDLAGLNYWNTWATATRETEELREQSWQMGRAMVRLLQQLEPLLQPMLETCGTSCNYAIAFAIAAAYWQISEQAAVLGYLHSWANNLASAGIKLIPLGQTSGQKILLNLKPDIVKAIAEILVLDDDDLSSCSWGLSLASMAHENQYTRLFRS
jgi:urease accessory protein